MERTRNSTPEPQRLSEYIIVGALIIMYISAYVWLHFKVTESTPASIWGQHGDAMAPLTGILSLMTLFFAIRSMRMQSEELQMQRLASNDQQKEMTATLQVLIEQAKAQSRQAELREQANLLNQESNELTRQLIDSYRESSRATIVLAINSIAVAQETLKVSSFTASETFRHSPQAVQTGNTTQVDRVRAHADEAILELERRKKALEQELSHSSMNPAPPENVK